MSVRQTFDGSKSESQPASFTWVTHDTKLNRDYYLVDAAVQITEPELLPNTTSSLLLRPVVEWHRDTTATTPTNALTAKLNFEFWPSQLHLDANCVPDDRAIHPFFILGGGPTRDFEHATTKGTVSFRASAFSLVPGIPGGEVWDRAGNFIFLYYPYLGVDWMDPVPSKGGQQVWTGVARLFVAVAPVPQFKSLELLLDYTYRYQLGSSGSLPTFLPLFIAGVNLYFDPAHQIALGFQYQRGHDVKDDFAFREKSGLALKIRI